MSRKLFLLTLCISWLAIGLAPATAQNPSEINDLLASAGLPLEAGNEILSYDYTDNEMGWAEYDEENRVAAVTDGVYLMGATGGQGPNIMGFGIPSTNGAMQIEATILTSGEDLSFHGLLCRLNRETGEYYEFTLNNFGEAYIGKSLGDDLELLAELTPIPSANTGEGAVNQLAVVCAGDYLALFVNGELALEAQDSDLSEGQFGYQVFGPEETQGAFASFDNLASWELVEAGSGGGSNASSGAGASEEGVLLEDTFDSNDTGWAEYAEDDRSAEVRDGTYVLSAEGEGVLNYQVFGPDDLGVAIIADAVVLNSGPGDAYGLACRVDMEAGTLYEFSIAGDGTFAIFKYGAEEGEYLVEPTPSEAINAGDEGNSLMVMCFEDYLAFIVNDEILAEVNDSDLTSGQAAFLVYSSEGPIEVSFDNLLLAELTPE